MSKHDFEIFRLEERVLFEAAAVAEIAAAEATLNSNVNEGEKQAQEEKDALKNVPPENSGISPVGNGGVPVDPADIVDIDHQLEQLIQGEIPATDAVVEVPVVTPAAVAPVELSEFVDGVFRNTEAAFSVGRELVIINSSVSDVDSILASLKTNQEVLILSFGKDGMAEINAYLDASGAKYDALHFVTHGNSGYFTLNGERYDAQNFDAVQWTNLGSHLTSGGDILFYGCNFAAETAGEEFATMIAGATGADVAASRDITGRGGNWILEYQTGNIETLGISVNGFSEQLASVNIASFEDLLENLGSASEYQIVADFTFYSLAYTDLNVSTTILYGVTIHGNNHTLTAGENTQIFNITEDGSLTLNNLTLKGTGTVNEAGGAILNHGTLNLENVVIDGFSSSENGGAIAVGNGGTLNISGGQFLNNTATQDGGAIYFDGNAANALSVGNGTSFNNNTANNGGAIAWAGGNGSLDSVVFIGNTGLASGGAIFVANADVTVSNAMLIGNSAVNGGAIGGRQGSVRVSDSSFTSNTAVSGGAVYGENGSVFSVENSSFLSNSASADGGAFKIASQSKLFLSADTLSGNTAVNGGGISIADSELFIESANSTHSTTISGSTVNGDGGAIYATGNTEAIIHHLTVSNTYATFGGGIFMSANSGETMSFSIYSSTFNTNSAASGGAIYALNSTLTVALSSFSTNEATMSGGAIYANGSTLTVSKVAFGGNKATGASASGGAIALWNSTLRINDNSSFIGNTAVMLGGAIASTNTVISVKDSKFDANTLSGSILGKVKGGAIYIDNSTDSEADSEIEFIGVEFTGNTAYSLGGAVFAHSTGNVTIKNSIFIGNKTTDMTATSSETPIDIKGGAIYAAVKSMNIDATRFESNQTHVHGGAIYTTSESLTITNSVFSKNRITSNNAGYGAAIASYQNGAQITIKNSLFDGNFSQFKAAGIRVMEGAVVVIYDSAFTNNEAKHIAGVLSNDSGRTYVFNSTFYNNKALNGGVATLTGTSDKSFMLFSGCTFVGNSAVASGANTGRGGCIFLRHNTLTGFSNEQLVIINSIFAENTSTLGDDIFMLEGGEVHLVHSLYSDLYVMGASVIPYNTGSYIATTTDIFGTPIPVFNETTHTFNIITGPRVGTDGALVGTRNDGIFTVPISGILNNLVFKTSSIGSWFSVANPTIALSLIDADVSIFATDQIGNHRQVNGVNSYSMGALAPQAINLIVTQAVDDGSGTITGTLSYVLMQAALLSDRDIILISFDHSAFSGSQIMELNQALSIDTALMNKNITINGDVGNDKHVTIDWNGAGGSSIFSFTGNGLSGEFWNVNLSNLTVDGNDNIQNLFSFTNSESATFTLTNGQLTGAAGSGALSMVLLSGPAIISIENSLVSNNSGTNGAGVYASAGTVSITVVNSTFTGNRNSGTNAGVIYGKGDMLSITVVDSTLYNGVDTSALIVVDGNSVGVQTLNLINSIIQSDHAEIRFGANGGVLNSAYSSVHTIAGTFTVGVDVGNVDNIDKNHLFEQPIVVTSDGTIALSANSQAAVLGTLAAKDGLNGFYFLHNGAYYNIADYSAVSTSYVVIDVAQNEVRRTDTNLAYSMGAHALPITAKTPSLLVTTTVDWEINPFTVLVSLREALNYALNAQATATDGSYTISFDLPMGAVVTLDSPLMIDGGTVNSISIDGLFLNRSTTRTLSARFTADAAAPSLFTIAAGKTVALNGLEIQNSDSFVGYDLIANHGALNITNTKITGDGVNAGRAIYNSTGASLFLGSGARITGAVATAGAGVYNLGSVVVDGALFEQNKATQSGGAIYNQGSLLIRTGMFDGNRAATGGAVYSTQSLTVGGGIFSNNSATDGGALAVAGGTFTVGALSAVPEFTANSAVNGGAIQLSGGAAGSIDSATFRLNTSTVSGGAIHALQGTVTIRNSTFTGNSTSGIGGALQVTANGNVTLQDSTLSGNSAINGGAIHNRGVLSIMGTHFEQNSASVNGGAVMSAGGRLTVQSSKFYRNTATGVGGAFRIEGGSTEIDRSALAWNKANSGGAISAAASVTLLNSTLYANDALAGSGGAVSITAGTFYGMGTTVTANTASSGQGSAFATSGGGSLQLINSVIVGNGTEDIRLAGASSYMAYNYYGRISGSVNGNNNTQAATLSDVFGAGYTVFDEPSGTIAPNPASPAATSGALAARDSSGNWYYSKNNQTYYNLLTGAAVNAAAVTVLARDQKGNGRLLGVDTERVTVGAITVIKELPGFVVDTTEDVVDEYDGVTSLREAILAAENAGGGLITFDPDAFLNGSNTIYLNSTILVTSAETIVIDGRGLESGVIISIDPAQVGTDSRVFNFGEDADVTLMYLTVTGGSKTGSSSGGTQGGGAIYNDGKLTLVNTTFYGNTVKFGSGGAIFNDLHGQLTVVNSTFAGNRATQSGGAIYTLGKMDIVNSVFVGNEASFGKDLYVKNDEVTIRYSAVGSILAADTVNSRMWEDASNHNILNVSKDIMFGSNMYDPATGTVIISDAGANLAATAGTRVGFTGDAANGYRFYFYDLTTDVWKDFSGTSYAGNDVMIWKFDQLVRNRLANDNLGYLGNGEYAIADPPKYSMGAVSVIKEQASMEITTNMDVIDPYDGLISLREALETYAVDGGYAHDGYKASYADDIWTTIYDYTSASGLLFQLDSGAGAVNVSKSFTFDAADRRMEVRGNSGTMFNVTSNLLTLEGKHIYRNGIVAGTGNIDVVGNFVNSNATMNMSAGTVTYKGGDQNLLSGSYHHLTLTTPFTDGTGAVVHDVVKTQQGDILVNGTFKANGNNVNNMVILDGANFELSISDATATGLISGQDPRLDSSWLLSDNIHNVILHDSNAVNRASADGVVYLEYDNLGTGANPGWSIVLNPLLGHNLGAFTGSEIIYGAQLSGSVISGRTGANPDAYSVRGSSLGKLSWLSGSSILPVGTYNTRLTSATADSVYNFGKFFADLTVIKRSITVTANSDSKKYDGTALTDNGWRLTEGLLVGYDTIDATVSGSQLNFGQSANRITSITITANGVDVSGNYSITLIAGTLSVAKRDVTVTAGSNSWVYDGTTHFDHSSTVSGDGFIDGEGLTVDRISGAILNAGSLQNTVEEYTLDSGTLARNYNITLATGTLTVTKRNVTITSGSSSWVYDGTEHFDRSSTVTGDGFVAGEGVKVDVSGSIIYVGSKNNTIAGYEFTAGTLAGNYNIILVEGKLTVTKASVSITVTADSASKMYDGLTLTNNGWEHTAGGLLGNDVLDATVIGGQLNYGQSANSFSSVIITNNGVDVTENYDIVMITGTLSVSKRDVTITSGSSSWMYDGTEHFDRSSTISGDGFIFGEGVDIDISGSIIYVGSRENTIAGYEFAAGTLADNYHITLVEGTLTVTKASVTITVTANSDSQKYNGSTLVNDGWQLSGELLGGDMLSAIVTGGQLNVGQSANSLASVTITNHGVDVSENYNIVMVDGTLSVTPREVIIVSGGGTWVYDGKVHMNPNYQVSGDGFVVGEGLADVDITGGQREVGSSLNTIAGHTLNGDTLAGNYNVTYRLGTLTVLHAGQNTDQDGSTDFYVPNGPSPYRNWLPGGRYYESNDRWSREIGLPPLPSMSGLVRDGETSISDSVKGISLFSSPLRNDGLESLHVDGHFDSGVINGKLRFLDQAVKLPGTIFPQRETLDRIDDLPELNLATLIEIPPRSDVFKSDFERLLDSLIIA